MVQHWKCVLTGQVNWFPVLSIWSPSYNSAVSGFVRGSLTGELKLKSEKKQNTCHYRLHLFPCNLVDCG